MKTRQKYVYLRPLTPAEADVAERNHYLVYKFLRARGLSPDEWYDVVVFRYLQTVIKWFEKPELYVYEFSTVAFRGMDSAVYCERKKRERRISAISLDETIPGTDGMTWEEIITEENLNYTPYLTEVRA